MSCGHQSVNCESDCLALEGESALVSKKDVLKKLFGKNAEWKYFIRVSQSLREDGDLFISMQKL